MEIGKYLDFHETSNDGIDYSLRVYSNNSALVVSGAIEAGAATFSGSITAIPSGMGVVLKSGPWTANTLISTDWNATDNDYVDITPIGSSAPSEYTSLRLTQSAGLKYGGNATFSGTVRTEASFSSGSQGNYIGANNHYWRLGSNSGYVDIGNGNGPGDTGYLHFSTGQDKFWFSKQVDVNGAVKSLGFQAGDYGGYLNPNNYYWRIGSSSGYVDIGNGNGPGNTSVLHFFTEQNSFYFNKQIYINGNFSVSNFGLGLVGQYASTRYQQVFAMGGDYTMAADGTALNDFYGIAWTHSNVGGQSIAGLGHQALFCQGGVTHTAIGTGVWTRGAVSAWGNVTAYASDKRLKENIEVIPDALKKVKALHGVTYQWNREAQNYLRDDGRRHAGVLAQEVQAVLPEAVCPAPFDVDGATGQSRTGQNYLTVQNERLVALLIEAVKELSAKVDRLEAEAKR